ncbi:MAG: ATP-binding protein [Ruminiclostridium sp.]|nr:ATP-binding protein [Ruminiclostridium sp.]
MTQLDIEALKENLPQVLEFVGAALDEIGCGHKPRFQIETAVEEVFVNIASYAYDPETGPATIRVETSKEPLSVIMSFIDHGKPYDPLAKPDVDLDRPMKERKKGGLGIFMVKKSMDGVNYEYKDSQNILTLTKNLG